MNLLALISEATEGETPWWQVGEHGNHWWLPHDLREVIVGTLAFAIVVYFLAKKGGPAIKKALASRTSRIAGAMDSAKAQRNEAEGKAVSIKAALADRDAKIAEIEAEAAATAAAVKSDLIARAEADAAAIVERGLAEVESSKRLALSDLSSEISRTSLAAAERVVHNKLDDAAHSDLIDQFIAQVAAGLGTKA